MSLPARPSRPGVGVLGIARPLHPHYAEPLTGGRLHHDPTLQALDDRGAELLEAPDFRGNVVGLDVEVDATFVLHALDLHDGLVRRRLQHPIVTAAARVLGVDRPAERLRPEARSRVDIGGIAVDQDRAKAGVMHAKRSCSWPAPRL